MALHGTLSDDDGKVLFSGDLSAAALEAAGDSTFSAEFAAHPDVMTAAAQGRLKTIVERIERLEEDKAAVSADLKEVYLEAKGEGFDAKIIRKVVRLRAQDRAKRLEEETILDLYMSAIGEI